MTEKDFARADWRKATASDGSDNCVEVAFAGGRVGLRESKATTGGMRRRRRVGLAVVRREGARGHVQLNSSSRAAPAIRWMRGFVISAAAPPGSQEWREVGGDARSCRSPGGAVATGQWWSWRSRSTSVRISSMAAGRVTCRRS